MSDDQLFDEVEGSGDVHETIDYIREIGSMIIEGHKISGQVENRFLFGASLVLAAHVVEAEAELCDSLQQIVEKQFHTGEFDRDDALSLLARHHMARYGCPPDT